MSIRLLPLIVAVTLVACGANTATTGSGGGAGKNDGGSGGGASGGGAGGGSGGGGGGGGGTGTGGGSGGGSGGGGSGLNLDGGCPDEAKIVYVVDNDRTFSSFDPATKIFRDIGMLNCPAAGGSNPFSMAVDRDANAWVLYSSGELFRVSTRDLGCSKSAFSSGSFRNFGMGFSTDVAGGTTDSLFIAGGLTVGQSSTLARLDVTSFQPANKGTLNGWPELTGTGDAKLWGFFPSTATASPFVAQIDKTNGSLPVTFPAPSIDGAPNQWAFAFWGGRFWIFLKRVADNSTFVYEMNATTGAMTTALPDTGRHIVGAGVSTCAPVTIN